jgi:hypothetical protein
MSRMPEDVASVDALMSVFFSGFLTHLNILHSILLLCPHLHLKRQDKKNHKKETLISMRLTGHKRTK